MNRHAADLGVQRLLAIRRGLDDRGAEDALGRLVEDVDEPALACRGLIDVRRALGHGRFVEGLDEDEREHELRLSGKPELYLS